MYGMLIMNDKPGVSGRFWAKVSEPGQGQGAWVHRIGFLAEEEEKR